MVSLLPAAVVTFRLLPRATDAPMLWLPPLLASVTAPLVATNVRLPPVPVVIE